MVYLFVVIALSKGQNPEDDEEIEKLKKDIIEFGKDANANYHRLLLKKWVITFAFVVIGFVVGGVILYFTPVQNVLPNVPPIESTRIEEISKVIFNATVTINGLIIGFVPLISFFFVKEIREHENILKQFRNEEQKEAKGKKLILIKTFYNLVLMTGQNMRSGVLRYTQTYVFVTIMLQVYLVMSYAGLVGLELSGLFLFIDLIFLSVVVTGLSPVISLALYQPSFKLVKYIIPQKEIWKIEPEK